MKRKPTREEVAAKWMFGVNPEFEYGQDWKEWYRLCPQWQKLRVAKMLRELDACEHPELKRDKAGRILCVCGKPLESSKHIQYGPDEDNPLKHVFDPATLDAAKPKIFKAKPHSIRNNPIPKEVETGRVGPSESPIKWTNFNKPRRKRKR